MLIDENKLDNTPETQTALNMLKNYMIEEIYRMRAFRKELHNKYPELLGNYTDEDSIVHDGLFDDIQ